MTIMVARCDLLAGLSRMEVAVWLSGRMRKGFAMTGLVVAAGFAYLAMETHWYLIPAVVTYGLTKLGIHMIPWRG